MTEDESIIQVDSKQNLLLSFMVALEILQKVQERQQNRICRLKLYLTFKALSSLTKYGAEFTCKQFLLFKFVLLPGRLGTTMKGSAPTSRRHEFV